MYVNDLGVISSGWGDVVEAQAEWSYEFEKRGLRFHKSRSDPGQPGSAWSGASPDKPKVLASLKNVMRRRSASVTVPDMHHASGFIDRIRVIIFLVGADFFIFIVVEASIVLFRHQTQNFFAVFAITGTESKLCRNIPGCVFIFG